MAETNRYQRIIVRVFESHYVDGATEFEFAREEMQEAADAMGLKLPKNLGDVVYSFRYRVPLPTSVRQRVPKGLAWVIRGAGRGRYRFVAEEPHDIVPNPILAETRIPDATPGMVAKYALDDEQALLARLRYNRLVDTFTGVACYSLQSHMRTAVKGLGQLETDEVYVGVDRRGAHYVFPVQAKGGRDRQNVVQIEQDILMCAKRFPGLISRPIAAQFMSDDVIALFELEAGSDGPRVVAERHYRLVPPDEVTSEDLQQYRTRTDG